MYQTNNSMLNKYFLSFYLIKVLHFSKNLKKNRIFFVTKLKKLN